MNALSFFTPPQVLILLDMNGLLVHRAKGKVPGARQPDFNVPTGGGYRKYDSFFYIR